MAFIRRAWQVRMVCVRTLPCMPIVRPKAVTVASSGRLELAADEVEAPSVHWMLLTVTPALRAAFDGLGAVRGVPDVAGCPGR